MVKTELPVARSDRQGALFSRYLERGIFGTSPFETLDVDGVGRLIRIAVKEHPPGHPARRLRGTRR